jgi:hypothetical protein
LIFQVLAQMTGSLSIVVVPLLGLAHQISSRRYCGVTILYTHIVMSNSSYLSFGKSPRCHPFDEPRLIGQNLHRCSLTAEGAANNSDSRGSRPHRRSTCSNFNWTSLTVIFANTRNVRDLRCNPRVPLVPLVEYSKQVVMSGAIVA